MAATTSLSSLGTDATDVLLVGGGIASATMASLLATLEPDWTVRVVEKLDEAGLESSDAWNNAGTGHAALCEQNYTPVGPDGRVDPAKAIGINESFQVSRQFWAHLVENDRISEPSSFIHPVPHISFVAGAQNLDDLRARHAALKDQPLFRNMEYTEDREVLHEWAPLMAEGRSADFDFAATRSTDGTDVDFGALTGALLDDVVRQGTTELVTRAEVTSLRRLPGGQWGALVRDTSTGDAQVLRSRFVFVGAGGAALELLQSAGIDEIAGFGGFPVSGQFLRSDVPELAGRHDAKVYSKAESGAPPMSVPHLDTRWVDGRRNLVFGPYAGFSPKFLKAGSYLDLLTSVRPGNLVPMLGVAKDNLDLVRYLVSQLMQSEEQRYDSLRQFVPEASGDDWELITAGQRVQVIAPKGRSGVLQFGTQVISSGDGSIAGMLGASPGASTATKIMLDLLVDCFPERADGWGSALRTLVPSWGQKLNDDPVAAEKTLDRTAEALQLG